MVSNLEVAGSYPVAPKEEKRALIDYEHIPLYLRLSRKELVDPQWNHKKDITNQVGDHGDKVAEAEVITLFETGLYNGEDIANISGTPRATTYKILKRYREEKIAKHVRSHN